MKKSKFKKPLELGFENLSDEKFQKLGDMEMSKIFGGYVSQGTKKTQCGSPPYYDCDHENDD